MNSITRTPLRVRHETRLRLVQVAEVEPISPLMRRITLRGEALQGFTSAAADDHVKLFFPAPGQAMPVLPVAGPDGPIYPEGAIRPSMRDYTPRRFDAANRALVIEFVLHATGPASDWAAQAAPGQWLGVGGPRSSFLLPDDYNTYLFTGDETALPAIARHLEELPPGTRALALIEVAGPLEERHLPTAANATIQWLHRGATQASRSTLLMQALKTLELPPGDTHAWLAGEIETVRAMRGYLIAEEAIPRAQIRAAGYWRLGQPATHARLDD